MMKKLIAIALLATVSAAPAFANKKPKQPHPKYDYRYHTPKYKVPKAHNHHSHPKTRTTQA
jgi:hypothetical protein